jgi:cytochrome P450
LLSILTETDFYQASDDGLIIDEIITFFLAGMKTIQVTTTNLIYYLSVNPEIKAKLLGEIKVTDGDLNYEQVMEFEYL